MATFPHKLAHCRDFSPRGEFPASLMCVFCKLQAFTPRKWFKVQGKVWTPKEGYVFSVL